MKTTVVSTTQRHRDGRLASHGLQVPLLSSGETHRGYFEAPKSAVTFKPHTNEVHSFSLIVRSKVREWVAWKEKQGWLIQGKPRVLVPVPKPSAYGEEADEETVRVYVEARFYRTKPLYVTLDDFLERMDQYERYNLNVPDEAQSENRLPTPVKSLVADGETDAMKQAEERRTALGLKRELVLRDGIVTGATVVPMATGDKETES